MLTLLLSDVVGDDPEVIGSGPTVADPSTVEGALRILAKYKIAAPALKKEKGALHETPKPKDPELASAPHLVVGSNRPAIAAASAKARELGYRPLVLSTTITG